MGKNKNRAKAQKGRRSNGGPVIKGLSDKCAVALLLCRIYGVMAPPKGVRSDVQYYESLTRCLFKQVRAKMSALGQVYLDPEMPDDWASLMGMILLPQVGTVAEYNAATDKLETLQAAANTGAAGTEAQASALGVTASSLESAQTWASNTSDWISQTFNGDWAGGASSFAEGWNSFFSGNFGL